jgi:hypothetical protein
MATKIPTRPKQWQSIQRRSWQNLTDRRKLRHLENTLDKAITKALQEGGIDSSFVTTIGEKTFKFYQVAFRSGIGRIWKVSIQSIS